MEPPPADKSSSRRLIFDCRYGWVVDEWKDPSEEALAGGRGMFCVVPLVKTLCQAASQTVNSVTGSALKVVDRVDLFSRQANLRDQLQRKDPSHA